MKLTARLVLIVFLAVSLLACFSGFIVVHQQFASFQKGREDKARELQQSVAGDLAKAWKERGQIGVKEALGNMQVEVRRTRMRFVQFDVDPHHPDSPRVGPGSLKHVVHGEIESAVFRDPVGEEWLHTYLPILTAGDRRAGIELSDSMQAINDQKLQTIRSTLLTLGGLALVCIGVIFVSGLRLVGRPLEQLIAKTKQISEGDFTHPVQIHGRDELSQLGTALNDMSRQLLAQKKALVEEATSRIATLGQLRHADRLKTVGRLAAGLAHELGTPLNVVAGRAGLIAGGKLSSDEVQRSAVTIKTEADRITDIIRQLLDFARHPHLQRRQTDLRTVVTRTVDLLTTISKSRRISIEIGQFAEPVVADIDDAQIQQVLTNLIMNAIQATPEAGVVKISLGTEAKRQPDESEPATAQFAFIQIADTGTGISEEHLDQLFEPFFTTKDVGEGTGLGLSIAYGIIQEHGGWIDVQSEAGHGSLFTIYLPKETTQ